ncbi:subtilisin-like protease SBT5.3 [Cornus florida]|uniref:subtilisin-like protease SBT5.3 n=1 Tax=Cornus florida TaxID=4283 RepID=UPI002897A2D4|nr:subtilisin-like protease SBT5.3 [Cornus florida]
MKLLCVFLLALLFCIMQKPTLANKKQSYVVYLGKHSHGNTPSSTDFVQATNSHHELLASCLGSKKAAKEAIFYSYTRRINGFAAMLDDHEVRKLSEHPEVVSVFSNKVKTLHTTRTWDFLGLERNGEIPGESIWKKARFGEDAIIGNLDTGVWPESESFIDEGMGPVPSKWKGYCETIDGVQCNRKLIGARYFNKGYGARFGPLNSSFYTARDYHGHGTHTLSTAGGRFVAGANYLGSANGTAKGGSPKARVASYKVCWPTSSGTSCYDADILAAFDAAIHDGVDVISVSLGGAPEDYFTDSIAIGAFHAAEKGILVVCSGGNSGPRAGSISNLAPWIFTIAASTIDRDFPSYVILGNNKQFKGFSFATNTLPLKKYYPLIRSVDAKASNASVRQAELCFVGSLDPMKVKGKIVHCLRGVNSRIEKSFVVAQAGGVGMILANQLATDAVFYEAHFLPTSHVSAADGLAILSYIYNTESPVAYISGATELGMVPAPVMAAFSSAGPNTITPQILKPDITAPGVGILAATTAAIGPSRLQFDERRVAFGISSGTSMSCPHISGIAGLLKTMHPDWSPSAIKSAIMTTARTRGNVRQPITNASFAKASPLNYGAGHVRPNSAMDPGLVYDLNITDYMNFLCAIDYNKTQLAKLVQEPYKCPKSPKSLTDFNYPSISVPKLSGKKTVTRTLKNVGTPGTYKVRVDMPKGILVKVKPESLEFEKLGEEKMFKVTLEAKGDILHGQYVFGGIVWSDGKHHVRSPIAVMARRKS